MRPTQHIIISTGVGVLVSLWLKSWAAGVACLIGGVLIDLDHVVDYVIAKKEITFDYKKFVDYCDNDTTGRIYLILHSWEALIIMWLFIPLEPIFIGALVGITVHLMCDQFSNPLAPLCYFISYRSKHGFERSKLFCQKYYAKISKNPVSPTD